MKPRKTRKPCPIFLAFTNEAEQIFGDGKLKIVAPNTGMELSFDGQEGKFTITGTGENYNKTKKYVSFEKAIDYMLLND